MMNKLLKIFMVMLFLINIPISNVLADAKDVKNKYTISIENISKPNEVYQGSTVDIDLSFKLNATTNNILTKGDKVVVDTNIDELFEIDVDKLGVKEIVDGNNNLLATFRLLNINNKIKIEFTIEDGADNNTELIASIEIPGFKAKNVGATVTSDVIKQLNIAGSIKDIIFKQASSPTSDDAVDIDTLWKNGWTMKYDHSGATISIEVNPIGSMDLYGSITHTGRKPVTHDKFMVEDKIPDKGFVDIDSVKIYAAVPTLAKSNANHKFNGWYEVNEGDYYAARYGTMRHRIDSTKDNGRALMDVIIQDENDTYEVFKEKVKKNDLSWGIYRDQDKNETFLCNFGNIGHNDDSKNNGIKYSQYEDLDKSDDEVRKKIMGDNGPTKGNIVSYYIEFDTYYPDIIGSKEVVNHADRYSYENGSNEIRKTGNDSKYIITNVNNMGIVRKNELSVLLKDKDSGKAIKDAKFKLQYKDENGNWVDSRFKAKTDEYGKLTLGPLANGKYRLIQLSSAEGYIFSNDNFSSEGLSNKIGKLNNYGEFEISEKDRYGFGTIVTNEKLYFDIKYEFVSSSDKKLPQEILDKTPKTVSYEYGSVVKPMMPDVLEVNDTYGTWVFKGYDKQEIIINEENGFVVKAKIIANDTFVGTWEYKPFKAKVSYEFISKDDTKLPQEILNLLPIDSNEYEYNLKVTPILPTSTTIKTLDGEWIFKGYDKDELIVSDENNFIGTWEFIKNINDNDDNINDNIQDNNHSDNSSSNETNDKYDHVVNTSDNSNISLWVSISLISLVVLAGLTIYYLKTKKEK